MNDVLGAIAGICLFLVCVDYIHKIYVRQKAGLEAIKRIEYETAMACYSIAVSSHSDKAAIEIYNYFFKAE